MSAVIAVSDEIERKKQIIRQIHNLPYREYAPRFLKIRPAEGELIPLNLNRGQIHLDDAVNEQLQRRGLVRLLILKGRQGGYSTYVVGRGYRHVTKRRGQRGMIIAHEASASTNLFNMTKRYHQHMDPRLRPSIQKSNAKELVFGKIDSSMTIHTAGSKQSGRSDTIQFFHGSEVAFWPNAEKIVTGAMNTLHLLPGTEGYLETTMDGGGTYFAGQVNLARKGMGIWELCFIPWHWSDEYRQPILKSSSFSMDHEDELYMTAHNLDLEQMHFRYLKIIEYGGDSMARIRFQHEFPATIEDAFASGNEEAIIPALDVLRAREATDIKGIGPRIMGVDVARFGKDRSVGTERQGRVGEELFIRKGNDTMQIAGLVAHHINQRGYSAANHDQVNIDDIGVGGGVTDRLNELGFRALVNPVIAGATAIDDENYYNKKAEMWGLMADWFSDPLQASIPNSEAWQADLTAPIKLQDSKYRMRVEDKKSMKKRGLDSTDIGDSFSHTFAFPVNVNATIRKPHRRRSWQAT